MASVSLRLDQVYEWNNLVEAANRAAVGKRGRHTVAAFETNWADNLLDLQDELQDGCYLPGPYTHFYVDQPKRRKISAAPFRDRVVHHAVCNVIEPWFESRFISDSYANRKGKGTHRAIDRLQQFARHYRYVLRLDIAKHFPSIDHQVLLTEIDRAPMDHPLFDLCSTIIESGRGVLDEEAPTTLFPGDDLFSQLRPRGLPIGNLTSQFWSNVYLNPLDQFVIRELRCPAYLRYVDDMALFSDEKREIWEWKQAIVERLQRLRLCVHPTLAQIALTSAGIPWLGFVVFPTHRLLKARMARSGRRRIETAWNAYSKGRLSFAEMDARVKGWVNHLRHADSWGLRKSVFLSL